MILGVKLDDYAQQLQPDTLGAYAEMGVRHLELLIADCDAAGPFLSADFARRMRALTARYGFTLSYHATPGIVPLLTAPRCRSAVYATLEDFFALMRATNALWLTMHLSEYIPRREKISSRLHTLREEIFPLMRRNADVSLCLENMPDTRLRVFHAGDRVEHLLDALRGAPENLRFLFDVGHFNLCDAPQDFSPLMPRLLACHLHDNAGQRDTHDLVGSGSVDWQALFARYGAFMRRVPLVLEYRHPTPDLLRRSIEFLRGWDFPAGNDNFFENTP